MRQIRSFHRPSFILLLALGSPGLASAQAEAPDFLAHFVYPRGGAANVDTAWVMYAHNCGRPMLDSQREAEVTRHDETHVSVDLYLVHDPEQPCLAALVPDRLHAVAIGTLPHAPQVVTRRLHVRPVGGETYTLVSTTLDGVDYGHAPSAAASGTWYRPAASGTGIVLNLLPEDGSGDPRDAVLFLASRTLQGDAEWLSGAGRFTDAVLSVPLRRAGTSGDAPADATGEFTYTGCGTATLAVDGVELVFPVGTEVLEQLTKTASVPSCTPPLERPWNLR